MRYNGLGIGHVDGSTRAPPSLTKERNPDSQDFSDSAGEDEIDIDEVDPGDAVEFDDEDENEADNDSAEDDFGDNGFFADGGDGDEGYHDDTDLVDIDDDQLAEY